MEKVVVIFLVLAFAGCSSGVSPVVEYNNAIQAWDRNDKSHIEVLSALRKINKDHSEYKRLTEKEAEISATQEKLRTKIEALKSRL